MKSPARRDSRGGRPERPNPPLRLAPPSPSGTAHDQDLENSLTPEDPAAIPVVLDGPPVKLDERYDEIEVIGSGGSGVVLLARDRERDVHVAIKRLRRASPDQVKRLLREARTIASLDHPGIVRLEQVVRTSQDEVALVLEHVDGPDLETWVRCEGPMPLVLALEVCRDVALALSHAHAHGVVHRDIKPGNILLGPGHCPKVTDFGLALPLCDPNSLDLTGGQLCGTLEYMAPEQRADSHAVDGRADVYGLGATLYRLITGSSPRVIRERALPALAREVVLRCVEEDRQNRYQSMDEVVRALEHTLDQAHRGAGPDEDEQRTSPVRRLVVAAAGLTALGLLSRESPEELGRRLEAGASLENEVPRLVAQVLSRAKGRVRSGMLADANAILVSALAGCELDSAARWAMHKLAGAAWHPQPSPSGSGRHVVKGARVKTPPSDAGASGASSPVNSLGLGSEHILEQVLSQLRVQALSASPADRPREEIRWRASLSQLAASLSEPHLATRVRDELVALEREVRARRERGSSQAA